MIKLFIDSIKIKLAKKRADMLHTCHGLQFYVIKWDGKIRVLSSRSIRTMKKKKLVTKQLTWLKLQEMAIYKTA